MFSRTKSVKLLFLAAILVVVCLPWLSSISANSAKGRTDANPLIDHGNLLSSFANGTVGIYVEPQELFDCDAYGAICKYFQLGEFFKDFPDAMTYDTSGGSNRNLPALSSFTVAKVPAKSDSEFLSLPSEFTFVHVHKCGGTSIKSALVGLSRQLGAQVTPYKYSYGGGSAKQKEANRIKREEHITRLKRLDTPVFAVVRDPVERFLSAVQQVMHYNEELRDKCLSRRSARKTIQCSIDDARERNFRGDVHLLPMVAHFRLLESIRVSVFPMEVLPILLSRYFGAGSHHVRDRTDETYATSSVLAKMSLLDCTKQMVDEICELYAMDVAFLDSIGLPGKHCSP